MVYSSEAVEEEGLCQLAFVLTQRCIFSWKWLFHFKASDPAAAKIDSQGSCHFTPGWVGLGTI